LGAWVALVVLVDPRAEVALLDDWTYALSVEQLVGGHGFRVSSWSSTFPAAQILLGGLFAMPRGVSVTGRPLSTLALAWAAMVAMRGLLLALGCGARAAALGAIALLLYPVAFVLSFTFMTDVPFVAATLTSLWAFVVGLRDGRPGPILAGLAAAVV